MVATVIAFTAGLSIQIFLTPDFEALLQDFLAQFE
jgi:hypothetical protein